MELENLKQIWNTQQMQAEDPVSAREDLLPILQKSSNGPVARMRRNLVCEVLLITITYIPCIIFYAVEFNGRLTPLSLLYVLLGVFFGGYYYRKMLLLNKMQCLSCVVRSNLAGQVASLKKYTRFYTLFGTLIIPIAAIYTYTIVRWRLPLPTGTILYHRLNPSPWYDSPYFWLLLLVPFTILVYYLNRWYVKKLYGRHIEKLQEILREMDEE